MIFELRMYFGCDSFVFDAARPDHLRHVIGENSHRPQPPARISNINLPISLEVIDVLSSKIKDSKTMNDKRSYSFPTGRSGLGTLQGYLQGWLPWYGYL